MVKTTSNYAIVFVFCYLLFFAQAAQARSPIWYMKLTQLQIRSSTKSDFLKLFLPSTAESKIDSGFEFARYVTPEGLFSVDYAAGDCPAINLAKCGFDVGTILQITVLPSKSSKASDFGQDFKRLEQFKEKDTPTEHFFDVILGRSFAVQRKKVTGFQMFHPSQYEEVKRIAITGNL